MILQETFARRMAPALQVLTRRHHKWPDWSPVCKRIACRRPYSAIGSRYLSIGEGSEATGGPNSSAILRAGLITRSTSFYCRGIAYPKADARGMAGRDPCYPSLAPRCRCRQAGQLNWQKLFRKVLVPEQSVSVNVSIPERTRP